MDSNVAMLQAVKKRQEEQKAAERAAKRAEKGGSSHGKKRRRGDLHTPLTIPTAPTAVPVQRPVPPTLTPDFLSRGGTVLGEAPFDNPFRPNWSIRSTDTALGESRVGVELVMKSRLPNDRIKIAGMATEDLADSVLRACAQQMTYTGSLVERFRGLNEDLDKAHAENGSLLKANDQLQVAYEVKVADLTCAELEIMRLQSELASFQERLPAQLAAAEEKGKQDFMASADFEKAKSDFAVSAFDVGFEVAKGQVKELYPDLDISRLFSAGLRAEDWVPEPEESTFVEDEDDAGDAEVEGPEGQDQDVD